MRCFSLLARLVAEAVVMLSGYACCLWWRREGPLAAVTAQCVVVRLMA